MTAAAPEETIHATSVAIGGAAVLIAGPSGAGKSDLALRLIDRGARLIADDYTLLRRDGDRLLAHAPPTIAGMIEVRGLGLLAIDHVDAVPVALLVVLGEAVDRLPEARATRTLAGVAIPAVSLAGLEASAPVKVELALRRLTAEDAP